MAIWKPTQAQCDLIKQAAVLESCPKGTLGQIKLDPGARYNTSHPDTPVSFNIAQVSSLPDWSDTDLYDRADWKTFRKGVELSQQGTAIIDFYIHARTDAIATKLDYLLGNIVVFYADGKLFAIRSIGHRGHDYLPALLASKGATA
ncbi:hypothetical protein [Pseudomonas amygdali]|uniref:Lipoprotein n=2 Tax=Pseudomonas amygdali pv. lachrymans TaxID=53707 RepID=A0ABR5KRK9_PSEAV|nr:hypothetical protein [Pseudomonas amygdali]AXH59610.1 hypothetical protein PLA107_030770 [Pseudomonas amygdali pv. lachrymans str. M301315]KPC17039.1 Uncharacterized protein AC499_0241 [Pseudomonas amygdali pv. lachrymans]KPC17998.1 Uncharacterized protein AC499_1200 [Pseudomonas amygdali pv. lachrymans]RMT06024.1 hypothetical protein ALP54_03529 [Pseudomonas amygdali pv. lachrymans]